MRSCPQSNADSGIRSTSFLLAIFGSRTAKLLAMGLITMAVPIVNAQTPRVRGTKAITSDRQVELVQMRQKLLVGEKGANPKPPSAKVETHHQLRRLSKALQTGEAFDELLADSAVGSGLFPSELTIVVENDQLKVEAAGKVDTDGDVVETADGASDLTDILNALKQGLAPGEEVTIDQFGIVEMSPTKFATVAWFESRSDNRTRVCRWDVEWQPNRIGVPIISKITGSGFRQTTSLSSDKLFADRTESVLGDSPAVRQLTEFDATGAVGIWTRQTGARASGVSIADINGDGLEDVFLPQPGGLPNLLFVRQADGTLVESASEWGLDWADMTTSAVFVDLDNDGDRDLVLATDHGLYVLSNDGKSFTKESMLEVSNGSVDAIDYNGDGLLDILICGAEVKFDRKRVERPEHLNRQFIRDRLRLFKNESGLKFVDATKEAGLLEFGSAVGVGDVDRDGDPDLFVAKGSGVSVIYTNEGGKFTTGKPMQTATSASIAWGDLDRDGSDDGFVGNGWTGFLTDVASYDSGSDNLRASGGSVLLMASTTTPALKSMNTGWTNSVQFADLDNSGGLDLVALNGFMTSKSAADYKDVQYADDEAAADATSDDDEISALFRSRVAEAPRPTKPGRLADMAIMLWQGRSLAANERNRVYLNTLDKKHLLADVSPYSGLDVKGDGRGLAICDWDNDGDLDAWISNRNAPTLQFFENQGAAGAGESVQLDLVGKKSNRDAIGATVVMELESGARLTRMVRAGQGYRSQSSHRVHIGLGSGDPIKAVVVRWPVPGEAEAFTGISSGGTFRLTEGTKTAEVVEPTALPIPAGGPLPVDVPLAAQDVLLPTRPVFPEISYVTSGADRVRTVDWEPGKPLLLVLWDPECDLCKQELRRLSKLRGLNCIALAPDTPKTRSLPADIAKQKKFLSDTIDESKGYHRVGFFVDEFYDDVQILHANLFRQPQTLRYPCSFLIDRKGRLAAVYRGQADLKTVIGHFTKLKLEGDELVQASLPLGGKLVGVPPKATNGSLFSDYLLARITDSAERIMAIEEQESPSSQTLLDMKSMLSQLYIAYRKPEKAAGLITEYLEKKPDDAQALHHLALLYAEKGDEAQAEKAWKKACMADSTYKKAWAKYGTFLMQKERYDEAKPIATQLLKIAPESIEAHNMVSILYLKDGDFEKAEGHLKTVIKIEPRAFGAYGNLSKAYAIQNRLPEARQVLVDALAIEGIDEGSRKGLERLLERYGK